MPATPIPGDMMLSSVFCEHHMHLGHIAHTCTHIYKSNKYKNILESFKSIFTIFVWCVFVYMCVCVYGSFSEANVWKTKDNLYELVLLLLCSMEVLEIKFRPAGLVGSTLTHWDILPYSLAHSSLSQQPVQHMPQPRIPIHKLMLPNLYLSLRTQHRLDHLF